MKSNTINYRAGYKAFLLLLLFTWITIPMYGHASVVDLEHMPKTDAAWLYIKLGYQHILPLGIDHILFVLSLFLLNPKLKPVLWQATAFTVAHTVTLGLSMYHVIHPPSAIVEPLIAISIMYVALENIFSPRLKKTRIGIVFLFGLVHGMGFASALGELGLPQHSYFISLLMFNAGVEFGQMTVIFTAYILFAVKFGDKPYYRKAIVVPLSIMIAIVAGYWTIQRSFF